jgi:hypothetical protein
MIVWRVAAAAGIGSTGEFEATLSGYPRGDTHKIDRASETTTLEIRQEPVQETGGLGCRG